MGQLLHGFSISVGDAVRLLAADHKVVVIVDQLDSVSELTDRRSSRLNLLLNLVRELSDRHNVHVLAACRDFDHKHDARLSALNAELIELPLPAWEDVAAVLRLEGHEPDLMGDAMRELLRTPWHLNLYVKIAQPGQEFRSLQSLIEAVWTKSVSRAETGVGSVELLEKIALRIGAEEATFVPASFADHDPEAHDALLREEILVYEVDGKASGFATKRTTITPWRGSSPADRNLSRIMSSRIRTASLYVP